MKTLWKWIYLFNGKFLFWIPGAIIASTKLYTDGDEYVVLRADGWVIVLSKTHPKYSDILPVTMVSSRCVDLLAESIGK